MESNLRLCKICKQLKTRTLAGKWSKDNKWTDESGKLWSGSVCPSCNHERLKVVMRIKRAKKDEVL